MLKLHLAFRAHCDQVLGHRCLVFNVFHRSPSRVRYFHKIRPCLPPAAARQYLPTVWMSRRWTWFNELDVTIIILRPNRRDQPYIKEKLFPRRLYCVVISGLSTNDQYNYQISRSQPILAIFRSSIPIAPA